MADIIQSPPQAEAIRLDALGQIERQVLWLSTAIIHHANRVRPNPAGMKVGGHQASSASMVSIMTSLWFGHLRSQDRVSVKPHASPVPFARTTIRSVKIVTEPRRSGTLAARPSARGGQA